MLAAISESAMDFYLASIIQALFACFACFSAGRRFQYRNSEPMRDGAASTLLDFLSFVCYNSL
jgi:hypothetical protein